MPRMRNEHLFFYTITNVYEARLFLPRPKEIPGLDLS